MSCLSGFIPFGLALHKHRKEIVFVFFVRFYFKNLLFCVLKNSLFCVFKNSYLNFFTKFFTYFSLFFSGQKEMQIFHIKSIVTNTEKKWFPFFKDFFKIHFSVCLKSLTLNFLTKCFSVTNSILSFSPGQKGTQIFLSTFPLLCWSKCPQLFLMLDRYICLKREIEA